MTGPKTLFSPFVKKTKLSSTPIDFVHFLLGDLRSLYLGGDLAYNNHFLLVCCSLGHLHHSHLPCQNFESRNDPLGHLFGSYPCLYPFLLFKMFRSKQNYKRYNLQNSLFKKATCSEPAVFWSCNSPIRNKAHVPLMPNAKVEVSHSA